MAYVFKGTTATNAVSVAKAIPSDIVSFSLANKTGVALTVSVGIFYGSTITYIMYTKSVAANDIYVWSGDKIRVPANYQIQVVVSGSFDYYFTLD